MIEQLSLEQLTLTVTEEIHVRVSLETTFETLLQEMGPHNVTPSGEKLSMKIEPWPGGSGTASYDRSSLLPLEPTAAVH